MGDTAVNVEYGQGNVRMKACIHSGSIESHVRSLPVAYLSHSSHDVILRWIQDIMSAKLLRKFFASWRHLGNYDLLGSSRPECLDDRQADGSTSNDQNGITLLEGTDVDSMPSYSQWLNEGWARASAVARRTPEQLASNLHGYMVWDFIHCFSRNDHMVR